MIAVWLCSNWRENVLPTLHIRTPSFMSRNVISEPTISPTTVMYPSCLSGGPLLRTREVWTTTLLKRLCSFVLYVFHSFPSLHSIYWFFKQEAEGGTYEYYKIPNDSRSGDSVESIRGLSSSAVFVKSNRFAVLDVKTQTVCVSLLLAPSTTPLTFTVGLYIRFSWRTWRTRPSTRSQRLPQPTCFSPLVSHAYFCARKIKSSYTICNRSAPLPSFSHRTSSMFSGQKNTDT
mgnify:CR=1 FL=1